MIIMMIMIITMLIIIIIIITMIIMIVINENNNNNNNDNDIMIIMIMIIYWHAQIIRTCHDNRVAENSLYDWFTVIKRIAQRVFVRFQLWSHKLFVKWTLDCHVIICYQVAIITRTRAGRISCESGETFWFLILTRQLVTRPGTSGFGSELECKYRRV